MRSDIAPGGTFPDYELPDHTDAPRKLSELQGDDPMILTLARGHYCPKEHHQHLELAAFYPKIAVAYTRIATIATDPHHTLQEFRASVGAQWPFRRPAARARRVDAHARDREPGDRRLLRPDGPRPRSPLQGRDRSPARRERRVAVTPADVRGVERCCEMIRKRKFPLAGDGGDISIEEYERRLSTKRIAERWPA